MHISWALQPYHDILYKTPCATCCGTLCCGLLLKIKPEMLEEYLVFLLLIAHKENRNSCCYSWSCWGVTGLVQHFCECKRERLPWLWSSPSCSGWGQSSCRARGKEGWAPGLAREHTCLHVKLLLRGLPGCLQRITLLMEPVLCAVGRDNSWHHAECNVPSEWDTPSAVVLDLMALCRTWSFQLSCTSES